MILRCFLVLLALVAAAGVKNSQAQEINVDNIQLTWTAPGDDSLSGRAAMYDLRYSFAPITDATFPLAFRVAQIQPQAPGSRESFLVHGLLVSLTYYFAIRTVDEAGNWSRISNLAYKPTRGFGLESSTIEFGLTAPRPNPVRDRTQFALTMPEDGEAVVEAFDLTGRRVATIASGLRDAGVNKLSWDLRDERGNMVGSGVYLVRARYLEKVLTQRITVVR